jgi:hypothetical protein
MVSIESGIFFTLLLSVFSLKFLKMLKIMSHFSKIKLYL